MGKKNVLFVAFQFVPLSVGGSYRPYRFVNYLKKNSEQINPIVLTLSPESYSELYEHVNLNTEAYKELEKSEVKIYHCQLDPIAKKGSLSQFLEIYFNPFRGSEAKYWEKNFNLSFHSILKNESIDFVYVTAPPFSIANLVRRQMKGRNIPFVVDMRDNWSLWLSTPHGSRIHYWINKYFERKLYQSATKIIGVTPQQLNDLESLLPKQYENKFKFIPNSFELDLNCLKRQTYSKPKNEISIGYVGTFYFNPQTHKLLKTKWYLRPKHRKLYYWPRKEWWLYRSPYFLFKLVNLIKQRNPEIAIRINFVGNFEDWLPEMVSEFKLENEVTLEGYLVGDELKAFYEHNNLMLATSVKVEGGEDYCIASKSYEYISSGKKVLGIVAKGAQEEFLKKSDNALIVDPDNLEANYSEIINFAKSETVEVNYNTEYLQQYTIRNTSKRLEDVFIESVISNPATK